MVEATYLLNTVVCVACTWLLFRGWRRAHARLLLLSALCFVLLSINNLLVVADKLVWTEVDLGLLRASSALAGFVVLLFGLIWESE